MKCSWLWLFALLVIGCSSEGTESGNPSRGCATRCACSTTLTIHLTDSVAGTPIAETITVDNQAFGCDQTGTCLVADASLNTAGAHDLALSAPGYAATTVTVIVQRAADCCGCGTVDAVDVMLDPLP